MIATIILTRGRIFDGQTWHEDTDLVIRAGKIAGFGKDLTVEKARDTFGGDEVRIIDCHGMIVAPGFVDLQVNGGGGLLLNDAPEVETIRTICSAHAKFGTTSLFPTLITDTPMATRAAMSAGIVAKARNIAGYAGLHLEGPHLSPARKGAHDPALIRKMDNADLIAILEAAELAGRLMVTVAPENVTREQVAAMAAAGIIVSLGHTDCSAKTALAYFEAGAKTTTHLFNAMSALGHREPGLVGATLASGIAHAGLIADGFHVDPIAIGVALRAKTGPGKVFLVTDAMSTIGTDMTEFTLNGRKILRKDGRLTLADGTLAGADIDMLASVRWLIGHVGIDLGEALKMASTYPAIASGLAPAKGSLIMGSDADIVVLGKDLSMIRTMIAGQDVFVA